LKKVFTVLLSSAILLSVPISSASAQEKQSFQITAESNYLKQVELIDGERMYTHLYDGVEITGNVLLTDNQVISKLEEANAIELSNEVSNEIRPLIDLDPDPYPGTIVAGPLYQNFSNATARETANYAVAWVATKVPRFISKSTFGNYVVTKFLGFSAISPTHVGSWQSRSYNNSLKLYEYHNTIVHYEDSQFRTPKSVHYYVVYRDTK